MELSRLSLKPSSKSRASSPSKAAPQLSLSPLAEEEAEVQRVRGPVQEMGTVPPALSPSYTHTTPAHRPRLDDPGQPAQLTSSL